MQKILVFFCIFFTEIFLSGAYANEILQNLKNDIGCPTCGILYWTRSGRPVGDKSNGYVKLPKGYNAQVDYYSDVARVDTYYNGRAIFALKAFQYSQLPLIFIER